MRARTLTPVAGDGSRVRFRWPPLLDPRVTKGARTVVLQVGVPEQAAGVPGAGPGAGDLGRAERAHHGRGQHPRPPASARPRKLSCLWCGRGRPIPLPLSCPRLSVVGIASTVEEL